jgi:integrase/recombinase XerD
MRNSFSSPAPAGVFDRVGTLLPTSFSAGVETSVIALWMGHENTATTQVYIHADLALKERAIARTAPQNTAPGRYQPADDVLAFLDGL